MRAAAAGSVARQYMGVIMIGSRLSRIRVGEHSTAMESQRCARLEYGSSTGSSSVGV